MIPEVPRVTAAPLPPKNGPRTARATSDAKSRKVERASGPLIGIPRFYRTCVRETIGPLSHAPKVMEILAERAARREIPTQGRTFAARARPIPIEYCPGALLMKPPEDERAERCGWSASGRQQSSETPRSARNGKFGSDWWSGASLLRA